MILEGLKNGILSKVQAVKDALSSAVTGVIDKAKSILDINSPSRVFMSIGDFTMQGMALGLKNAAGLPLNIIKKTHQDIIQTPIARPNIRATVPLKANRSAGTQVQGDTITMHIHAQPGQSAQQIAQMVNQMLNQRESQKLARVRNSFTDNE